MSHSLIITPFRSRRYLGNPDRVRTFSARVRISVLSQYLMGQLVADYFVLEGASPRAIALARWRLVELYRACGLDPQQGQQIDGSQLLDATVLVAVAHQRWNDHVRLRVLGYRPAWATEGSDLEDTP